MRTFLTIPPVDTSSEANRKNYNDARSEATWSLEVQRCELGGESNNPVSSVPPHPTSPEGGLLAGKSRLLFSHPKFQSFLVKRVLDSWFRGALMLGIH